ncbi:hypothetical protein SDC9_69538 [bioreactor metagenome]|uniref:Uncharacterized protein n=1 Tax=bioreactor metagenome TaxID=1076179 RepID=A0A644Y3E6_9ZZZZ
MWNRRARIIWFVLDKEDGKVFHLKYPIFCNVFRELADSFYDLAAVLCFFVPAKQGDSRFSVHTAKELTQLLIQLFGTVTEAGTYDLVDARTNHINFRLSVKNKLTS